MTFSRRPGARFNRGRIATVVGGGAAPFTPSDLPNLLVWFDMQDASSYTQAGTVTSITNKASAVAWEEATNPPAYSATGLNGFPAMDPDGTNDRIISTEAAVYDALEAAAACTVYVVFSAASADRAEYFFGIGNSGVATNRTKVWGKGTTGVGTILVNNRDDAAASVTVELFPGSVRAAEAHSYCFRHTTTTIGVTVDKAVTDYLTTAAGAAEQPAFAPSGTQTANRAALFCRPDSTPDSFYDGLLGELLIYTGTHDEATVIQLQQYLTAKWGIADPEFNVLCQGDSIPNGFGAGSTLAANLTVSPGSITNLCSNGETAVDVLATEMPGEVLTAVELGNPGNIMTLLIGSNDLVDSVRTPAQVLSDIAAIVALARLYTIKTVTGTIVYRDASGWGTNPDFNGDCDTVNAALLTNAGGIYGDVIVDSQAAIEDLGGYPTGYSDSTHLDATGMTALAACFQAGLDIVIATIVFH